MIDKVKVFLSYKVKSVPVYVILLLLVVLFVLYKVYSNSSQSPRETFANLSKSSNFMMFYTDWCPHCQHAKPEFKKVMDKLSNGELNGHTISVKMINAEEDKDLAKEYNVEGYPTIILTKDNKNYTYEGNRTEKDMMSYLETMLRY